MYVPLGPKPPKKVLITGALGQIGQELVPVLQSRYGPQNVIRTDSKRDPSAEHKNQFYILDVRDKARMTDIVVSEKVDCIIHNAAILSATGEKNPDMAMDINMRGTENALMLAAERKLRVFSPSSIAAFGGGPVVNTPDVTIQNPATIYGISKVYNERLGEYLNQNKAYKLDFRSLRYPGIISSAKPGGGTTDYAVNIFFDLVKGNPSFSCFLTKDSELPMMYMTDCINATLLALEADLDATHAKLGLTAPRQCTFNVSGCSFTPDQLYKEILKHRPNFKITYDKDQMKQDIADSWPKSLDDTNARKILGYKPLFDLPAMVKEMIRVLEVRKAAGTLDY